MSEQEDNGLHLRAIDYRTAATQHAEQAWQALDAHVAAMVAQAVAKERARWDGVEQYLTAAADGSMSRNNSEALAAELLEQIRGKA